MADRPAKASASQEPSCLYPDEIELAACILGKKRAGMWRGLAIVLERRGLPRVDVEFGGRYWPAVKRFLDRDNGLDEDWSERRASR